MTTTHGQRAELAARANRVASDSRHGGAPTLTPQSDAETIACWLQWCDPNIDPYTEDTAWEALAEMPLDT